MVGLLADSRYFSGDETSNSSIFSTPEMTSEPPMIFFANRRNPDGTLISHKALYRSIN